MPFVSNQGQRETLQSISPLIDIPQASFGETFAASLGQVFDENLSISGMMNREGWGERKRLIKEQIASDNIKWGDYTDIDGHFDWNAAAEALDDPAIKTDAVLSEERKTLLESRRRYADDVIERGGGMAQFLGAANAYVLDPISILTMPLAAPVTTAKSLSIVGRALLTARGAATIEVATELAIQPLVYNHKLDIESPYSVGDAIENIGMAAIGGGVLGGITGGISGYLRSVREAAEELPQTEELVQAIQNIVRAEETISHAPAVDIHAARAVEVEFIAEVKAELLEDLSKLEQGVLVDPKHAAEVKAELLGDLDGLDKGVVPDAFQGTLNQLKNEQLIQSQKAFMQELDEQAIVSGKPSKTPEQYAEPEQPPAPKAPTTARESDVLSAIGITEDFNKAMDDFSRLDNPIIVDEAGELIDAHAAMKSIDDELGGIESVLVCSRG